MRHLGCWLVAALALASALPWAGAAEEPGTVDGRVFFEDGSPAPLARVVFLPGGYNTTADQEGNFHMELPPGNYTMRASAGNAIAEAAVEVQGGAASAAAIRIDRGGPARSSNIFPFVYLAVAMVAVFVGGMYVNRRMAESGLDVNKSIVGGATVRKPFRRRKKAKRDGGRPPSP